jgi:hypothetical protein
MLTLNVYDWVTVGGLIAVSQFLSSVWIKARLEASIKAEKDRQLEDYRYQIRVREQAGKAAEYLSLAWKLDATDSKEVYQRTNQLSWELALLLPANDYREMVQGLAHPTTEANFMETLVRIRKLLLSDPGNLTAENIAWHWPEAARSSNS